MIIKTRKELEEIKKQLEVMHSSGEENQIIEGIEEDDDDFITNDMDDILGAIASCKEILKDKKAKFPVDVPFCGEETTFVENAIEDIKDGNT